ncbi:TadB-like protein involved in pilus formation and/or protein secretion [Vibrio ichthyoenteri ATCC 700023]|uniref:TadB-like protein involved in pilus formation and/or protein secretion n=1 Tax=Vibrio ichthyoenteri ATCC 700023 TaxID=870968 RepID=F9RWY6_9VIBR|nr:type II secretion system F family protein [Vibrio ichthyoenteri]EGU48900.1 TadB-like protein involved in pilus formation and/or protein secretion [Vibrio ichthyoenteri ATCC 700023]
MIYFALLGFGVLLLLVWLLEPKKKQTYLEEFNRTVLVSNMTSDSGQAVDLKSLSDRTWQQMLQEKWANLHKQVGRFSYLKIIVVIVLLFYAAVEINNRFFRGNVYIVALVVEVIGLTLIYMWLQKREREMFEESFPDALNMLASAVSSGESIMHAIMYVGKSLDGDVGAEFRLMGERLQLGESADDVLRKSCRRFPYASFHFFVITLRANMHRGGQLRDVITRLNRLMFDARSIDKKKYAFTSEARMSAKIVAAIPFIFLFIMQSMSPANYDFVMFTEAGRPILYYMLVSESIGMLIIWMLMRGVR